MNRKISLAIFLFSAIFTCTVTAGSLPADTNKMDGNGKKQGLWIENLGPTKWLGNYVDGKKEGIWVS
ncbi:MAG TPA: hypothetical protein VK808_13605, partial [Bacteroidia bacterium]|nr:hypothetical protein [Bacteroidia bacterium]